MQGGQWNEARLACAALCKSSPQDAEAWFMLGVIYGQLENFVEAENCCRRVIVLNPAVPVAHFNLGIALQKQRKFDESAECFRQATLLNPKYAEAHNELGATLQLGGADLDKVEACYRQAVTLKANYAEARYNLGMVLRHGLKSVEAVAHFAEVVRLQPSMLKAQFALSAQWSYLGNHGQAFVAYQEALRLHPDESKLHYLFGKLLITMGRSPEALDVFRRLSELDRGNPKVYAAMAQALEREGNFESGYDFLRPFLEGDDVDVDVVLAYADLSRHLGHQIQARELLERSLNGQMPVETRKAVHYALGKICDGAKDYDLAFAHYRNANDLAEEECDMGSIEQKFNELKAAFSVENLSRRPRAKNKSRLPVFIVGMPRSGTSLVEQILASHPDVYGAGELGDITNMVNKLPGSMGGMPYPYCLDALQKQQIDQMATSHIAKLHQFSSRSSRVTDKMPHNFQHLGLIDMLFPGARIIHCKRNPVDTCFSIYSLNFNQNHRYSTDLANLGAYYRLYEDLMAHWKKVLRIPILEVQYEEVVANQEEMSRKMIDFCDLKWDERCLDFHQAKREVATHSYDQVRRPIYKKSVARWKNYEKHLGPLIAVLGMDSVGLRDE